MSAPTVDRPEGTVSDLVDAARAGDVDAFGQLYERYQDIVFRFVYRRTGNRQLAEDLTADAFTRALVRIGRFNWQGSDPGAWFITIARNLVADHFKSAANRLCRPVGTLAGSGGFTKDDAWHGIPDTNALPDDQVADHHLAQSRISALNAALAQLTPDQRRCLVLRFVEELSVSQTAAAMGINEGAAKALQYRAVRALGRLVPHLGNGAAPKRHPVPVQRRQAVPCETCGKPVAGLLAECTRKRCQRESIAQTAREEARIEAAS